MCGGQIELTWVTGPRPPQGPNQGHRIGGRGQVHHHLFTCFASLCPVPCSLHVLVQRSTSTDIMSQEELDALREQLELKAAADLTAKKAAEAAAAATAKTAAEKAAADAAESAAAAATAAAAAPESVGEAAEGGAGEAATAAAAAVPGDGAEAPVGEAAVPEASAEAAVAAVAAVAADAEPSKPDATAAEGEAMAVDEEPVVVAISDDDIRASWLSVRSEVYTSTRQELAKRKPFEEGIKRPYFHVKPLDANQLSNWVKYSDYMEQKGEASSAVTVFERCLVACASYPGACMWRGTAWALRPSRLPAVCLSKGHAMPGWACLCTSLAAASAGSRPPSCPSLVLCSPSRRQVPPWSCMPCRWCSSGRSHQVAVQSCAPPPTAGVS